MYSTTAYLYQQIQPVLLIDISGVGATFDRRWQPVYAKSLKLNLGVDNVILFQFQNQDQKPVNITGSTFTFRVISQDGQNLLYAKELVVLNAATGRAKVTIPSSDNVYFQPQPASWSLEVSSGVLEQAVFTDDYSGARGDIDIVDSVFPAFVASQVLTIPSQAPANNVFYSSTVTTDGFNLTTFQLDSATLTGNLAVQGSSDATAYTVEWYNVQFEDLKTGNTVSNVQFTNSTERLGFNVEGYHPYLRLSVQVNSGNVDLIQYR
jgi:hypothetical protein